MNITIDHDIQALLDRIRLAPERLAKIQTNTINDVAFDVRADLQQELRSQFDKVTPYILNSIWVDRATDARPEATVYPRYKGGKGVDPSKVLAAEVRGGARRSKRFEVALQRAGLLGLGMAAVPASGIDASKMDAYGNVKGSFIVQLLSYLKAFGEQGYSANMGDKRKALLAKKGKTDRGFATINGVQYFVSHGRGTRNGREQHLAAGIWSRSGIHGSNVKPVFIFTNRMPSYTKLLDLKRIGETSVRNNYERRFASRLTNFLNK